MKHQPLVNHRASKQGFTIVELMLAMTFVAILLIAIAIVTINIVTIYQRGLSIKAVNNVGRSLIEELTTAINNAPAVDTTSLCNHLAGGSDPISYSGASAVKDCIDDHAYRYTYNDRFDSTGRQYSGVFCTGNYSYIWNTEYGLAGSGGNRTISLKYRNESGGVQTIQSGNVNSKDALRLIRVLDRTYRVCSAYLQAYKDDPGGTGNWEIDITQEAKNGAENRIPMPTTGYLNAFDLDLFLYEFTVQPISQDAITLRTYMAGDFVLATERGGIDITASGDYCQNGTSTSDLGNLGAEFNYCAINKFNFAARTAGV